MEFESLRKIKKMLETKSITTPYKWVKGLNRVTASTAKRLEDLTGIDRRKFCWPDEFGDPWAEVEQILKKNDL